jgi:hypothetical protein
LEATLSPAFILWLVSAFWALALADDPVLTQSWRAYVDVRFGTIAEVPRDGVPGASRRTASGLI